MWKSAKQASWGHSPEGRKALGGAAAVAEWDKDTNFKKLPVRVKKPLKRRKRRGVN